MPSRMKMAFVVLLTAFICSAVQSYARHVPVLAEDGYPPYCYCKHGKLKGIYVDIMKRIDELLPEYEFVYHHAPWKRALAHMRNGNYPLLIPPYRIQSRTDYIKYSPPLFYEKVWVYVYGKDQGRVHDWIAWLQGKVVGVNRGYAVGGEDFRKSLAKGRITKVEHKTTDENLTALAREQFDVYIGEELSVLNSLDRLDGVTLEADKLFKLALVNTNSVHIGYSLDLIKYPYLPDLEKRIADALALIKSNGEMTEIVRRHVR